MRRELRDYLLWRAGYRAGEKPDRTKLMFRPVPVGPITMNNQSLLLRAGYRSGENPDHALIRLAVESMDKQRHFGYVPDFPLPLYPVSWRNVVKRSAWGFFSSHCRRLSCVGSSETL